MPRKGPDGSSIPYGPNLRKQTGAPFPRPPASGMGNPYEQAYFYEGWRDWGRGEPPVQDIIHDPKCDPKRVNPQKKEELDALFCLMHDFFQRSVIFTKFPGNVQPPWFAQPIIKAIRVTVAAGATATLFTREIPEKYRAIITCFGIDVAPVLALTEGTLEFWFEKGLDTQNRVNLFDDQTETAYEETDGVDSGKTAVLPGSLENPFNLLEAGLQLIYTGRTNMRMRMENKGDDPVVIRGILGYYQYWMPYGKTEFEQGDVQL